MSEARIEKGADGSLRLAGVLDYRSGPALREQGQRLILEQADSELSLDCSAVEKSSSVGLSLLLAFMRDAKSVRRTVRVVGVPDDMLEIARVSGLLDILPLDAAQRESRT